MAEQYQPYGMGSQPSQGYNYMGQVYNTQTGMQNQHYGGQYTPQVPTHNQHIIDPNYAGYSHVPSAGAGSRAQREEKKTSDNAAKNKFKVSLKGEFGETYSAYCEIGMDSLKLTDISSGQTLHSYPLDSISRWALRDSETFLFWVQIDEKVNTHKQIQLSSNSKTVSNILDMLTAACMQLCEMIEQEDYKRKLEGKDNPKPSQTQSQSRKGLVGWIAGKVSGTAGEGEDQEGIATSIPEGIEYWKDPDYDGWLRSQGEHIKTWRRRWFVLKDGYMFRFLNDNVTEQSKPRGCLNLGACKEISQPPKDVSQGPTIQCSTTKDNNILYVADSSAERDLWIDILKRAAADVKNAKDGKYSKAHNEWMAELDAGFKALQKQAPNRTVEVLGYDTGSFSPSAPREEYYSSYDRGYGSAASMPANQGSGRDRTMDNWKVCYTPDGRAYYYNPATGTTQWEAP